MKIKSEIIYTDTIYCIEKVWNGITSRIYSNFGRNRSDHSSGTMDDEGSNGKMQTDQNCNPRV